MVDIGPKRIAEFIEPFRVEPGRRVRLPRDFDPTGTRTRPRPRPRRSSPRAPSCSPSTRSDSLPRTTYGVLLVLQAMDAAGKDGTIRHVMSGVNPQGVQVSSFKIPSSEDLDHDYLWRYAKKLPERGNIGIFNRSYYEEVLVVRVHPQILAGQKLPAGSRTAAIWKRRFREINDWEHYLTDQGYRIVKIFLNLSKEEQRRRFLARIDEEDKNWKFSANDAKERSFWDDYQKAFSEVLCNTSTEWAPWYVIPADDKPFARVAAAGVLANALIEIDPRFRGLAPRRVRPSRRRRWTSRLRRPQGAAADPIEAELAEKRQGRQTEDAGRGRSRDRRSATTSARPTPGARRRPGMPSARTTPCASRAWTSSSRPDLGRGRRAPGQVRAEQASPRPRRRRARRCSCASTPTRCRSCC